MKKIKTIFYLFLFILSFFAIEACSVTEKYIKTTKLENGDLIFVNTDSDFLSEAINKVTQMDKKMKFDHVGIIEKTDDSIFVLHASPKRGSNREIFTEFHERNNKKLTIFRLKKEYKSTIEKAITQAKSMLGKPYNWEYILNEYSYYCSDYIERAFRDDHIFQLIPMNFKDPATGKIDHYWAKFYDNLGIDVPQNQPGTNPNQLAASDKLVKLGPLVTKKQ